MAKHTFHPLKTVDEFIRDVLGGGGASAWLLLMLTVLGVATGGFALIAAGSIAGVAFLKWLFEKAFPDFAQKHAWYRYLIHYPMLFVLQVLGGAGALAFVLTAILSAAGISLSLAMVTWITLYVRIIL